MSKEDAKKRKRDGGADDRGSGGGGVDVEKMMAEMKAQMERAMESRLGEMQNELDEVKSRCESLERSVQILAKDVEWKYSAPSIPTSHWIDRGFDEDYIEGMKRFLRESKDYTCALRSGTCDEYILLGGGAGTNAIMLLHDDALLPHWGELANALQLYQNPEASHRFAINSIQLPSTVMSLLTPALKDKPFVGFALRNNGFVNAREGIEFAIEIIQSNRNLTQFAWVNNSIESMADVNHLVDATISHPLIDSIRLGNCFGENADGYEFLCLLVACNKPFATIDLESNHIRIGGSTELPGILATNPPLCNLFLEKNHLDDNDAVMIARALKQNTNLRRLLLGQNDITGVGRDALRNAVFDSTSLNTVADSNHSCNIEGIDLDHINDEISSQVNRGRKIYSLLSSRHREGTNVHHLDAEFGDESLKLVPKVLECVNVYAAEYGDVGDVHPLSIMYEILRSWKMPTLYANNGG